VRVDRAELTEKTVGGGVTRREDPVMVLMAVLFVVERRRNGFLRSERLRNGAPSVRAECGLMTG
jgi:hypothetical protein